MPPFTAFLDANVLYPAELRSFLMFLAVPGIFRARWSDDVHEEWISNLLERRPDLTRSQLERTRQLMDKHAPDALVTGYRRLVPALNLPDPNDRHVLAAAVRGGASVIVTNNTKDFPAEALEEFEIEAQTPDEFIQHLIDLYPDEVLDAAKTHRASLLNPPKTREGYLITLERQGLPQLVHALRAIWIPDPERAAEP
jgi:predicted nucleic acid-binding protein